MAEINIKYSHWQKPLSSDHLGWIAKTIEQDIKCKKKEGTKYPKEGEINVKGLEENVVYGYSTIKYNISWWEKDPKDPDCYIKSIEITID